LEDFFLLEDDLGSLWPIEAVVLVWLGIVGYLLHGLGSEAGSVGALLGPWNSSGGMWALLGLVVPPVGPTPLPQLETVLLDSGCCLCGLVLELSVNIMGGGLYLHVA
jgi:hypothetical protein